MGLGTGEGAEKELGLPGENPKGCVAGKGGDQNVPSPAREVQDEQVIDITSNESEDNPLSTPGGRPRKTEESATTGC